MGDDIKKAMVRISITGTPGTGKHSIARRVSKRLHMALVDLGPFARENGLTVPDPDRYTNEVTNMDAVKEITNGFKDCLLVSNWAELIPNELCFVTRCHPLALVKRLTDRDYPFTKVRENVEAECLDYCLISALDNCGKVAEIDNTKDLDMNAQRVADIILGKAEPEHGKIDYSEYVDRIGELIQESI